jgi:ADP-ribose pyrophosphatase
MNSLSKPARIVLMDKFERGELLNSDLKYSGCIVDLEVDQVRIAGKETIREVVRHPGGVVILAELQDGRIPFVRQHRYPIDNDLLELPAGKQDDDEEPATSAARELEEETGFRPLLLEHVSSYYTSPGFCDELLHFYYSDQLEETGRAPEEDEDLEVEYYTLEEALGMVSRGEIVDGKTIMALLWLQNRNNSLKP